MIRRHPHTLDPTLHFTEHFARYGFAVVPGLLSEGFCRDALARINQVIGHDRPRHEWDSTNTPTLFKPYFQDGNGSDPVFDKLFHEPLLVDAIHQLFGNPALWNHQRNYYLFLRPFEPHARPAITQRGHVDFPTQPLPPVYCGFTFQASLVDSEPFSGNITVHPRSHIELQRRILENPAMALRNGMDAAIPLEPPFEFVAERGDVMFIHHLLFHSSNPSHAAGRSPRVVIHAEAFSDHWPTRIDPADPRLSPWERSLAHNGVTVESIDTQRTLRENRRRYIADLKK